MSLLYKGFLLSIFLEYVRPGSYLPVIDILHLNSLVPLTVFVFTVFHKSEVSDQQIFSQWNGRWLQFFVVLLTLSVLTAEVTEYSYNTFTNVLGFLFWFYIAAKLCTTEAHIRALFAVHVFSHVLLLLLNLDLVLHPEVRSYIYGNSYLGDGNDFSLSVAVSLPMCLYLIVRTDALWKRVVLGVALVLLILGIVGTQSRGATVALVCVMVFLWWKGRKKVLGLALIAILTAGVVSYAPDVYFSRLNTIANYEEEGSAMGRIIAWKTGVRMAMKYPILGVGTGHYAIALGTEFRPPEWGMQNLRWATAHSMYFLLLGELGIPGITFLLAMLIGNYFINNRLMREARDRRSELAKLFLMLNASLIAFAAGGAFLSVAYYPHLYLLAGTWAAAYFVHKREQTQGSDPDRVPDAESPEQRAARLVWEQSSSKEVGMSR